MFHLRHRYPKGSKDRAVRAAISNVTVIKQPAKREIAQGEAEDRPKCNSQAKRIIFSIGQAKVNE